MCELVCVIDFLLLFHFTKTAGRFLYAAFLLVGVFFSLNGGFSFY